jgi:hypothetical protein
MMNNWIKLSKIENEVVWNKIYEDFKFEPSISKFPSFSVPRPFITFDISNYFGQSEELEVYDDLEEKALIVFQNNTSKDEYLMALDWQHECFWVNPHLEFDRDEFGEWTIPIFPNGDYYFFIQKEFKWGYLGHPWEKSITIFGEDLISSFQKQKPRMFQKILRQE